MLKHILSTAQNAIIYNMSVFNLMSVIVPITLAILVPRVLQKNNHHGNPRLRLTLYLACFLYFISWYLPSPLIHGQDTGFTTHFLGGGIFTGLFWLYLKQTLHWKSHWITEFFSLFALVSALGCLNELTEIAIVEFGLYQMTLADTSWDILANSLGAILVFVFYVGARFWTKDTKNKKSQSESKLTRR